jgi:hypothetical protein
MSTPEINLQLDNFLEKKGLLGAENPTVGPPVPTIQQSLNSSLDSFLKYKGFQIPGGLPNEKPPQVTPEMRAYAEKEFAPSNVQPSFISAPPAKEGEFPKIETTPGPTPGFWQQAKDLAVAWAKGKIGPEDLVGVDFFKGLTLGNIDPYDVVEKISGKPGFKQMAETTTRARIESAVGYEPTQATAFVGGASHSLGQLAALSPILKGAGAAAKILPKIPMLRAVARGVVAGTLTGAIQKPDEEGVWNRLKQVPPNVLFFTAFETLGVTAEQMLKIFEWNGQFGKVKSGATVEYVSKEVPGEATAFSADEMKELFRKMNANAAGTGGAWSRITPKEQEVINVASKSPGWKQAVKEGFFQEGTPQTIYGAKVTPELIPRKPQMRDLFRNEANLPKYQPTGEAEELWPSKWPREEGGPSPVEPPIPGGATAGPTVAAEGAKVPVGKTVIDIKPQPDGTIRVEVAPRELPQTPVSLPAEGPRAVPEPKTPPTPYPPTGERRLPENDAFRKALEEVNIAAYEDAMMKAEYRKAPLTPTEKLEIHDALLKRMMGIDGNLPHDTWKEQWDKWRASPRKPLVYPARKATGRPTQGLPPEELTGLDRWKYEEKMGIPHAKKNPSGYPARRKRTTKKEFYEKMAADDAIANIEDGKISWGELTPDQKRVVEEYADPEMVAFYKTLHRTSPSGETLGEFQGAGYQGADKEQVREDYKKWLLSQRAAPRPPLIEELPPGEAYNIRRDAETKAKAEADYAKNLRAGTIERQPKPEVPAVQFTDAEKAKIAKDVTYLTSGSKTPMVWRKNPEQIEANRNELIKQALLKLPAATPEEIKRFVNNYAPNIKGEILQTRKQQAISKEGSYIRKAEGKQIDIAEEITKEMLPPAGPEPIGKKPVGEQEIKYERRQAKDIFKDEEEEVRVLDALDKAAGGDEKILEILKSKLLADMPETDLALSKRIGVPKSSVSYHFRKALAKLKDSPEVKDIMRRHFVQLNVGPLPSEEQLRKLAKFANKFFTSTKGVDKTIDRQNDERLGRIAADAFEQTLNIGKLFKWVKHQDIPGLEGYLTDLVTGAISGDGYTDIANSNLPQNIKDVLTAFRTRTDALSDMIATEADISGPTKDAFDANMGKYLHKYYRLYEDKAWSPSDQQKAGFKDYLQRTYDMTADEAEASMEADLAYARNDELLKPRHKRNTKAVPAGSFIKRKALSPEWRAFAGEIDRATYLMIKTTTSQAVTAYNAKFLGFLSDYLPDLWTADAELAKKRGWQHSQLPSTYRYGKLRGKYVSPQLQEYIQREFDISTSGMEKIIQKFLITPYKWTKTIGSYPGHMRNLMGNAAFSMLARCSIFDPLNYGYYARSVKAHLNRGKTGPDADLWKSLIKDGITETQYWGSEIPRLYDELLRFEPATWIERLIDKTIKMPIDKLGELYNFGDSVYRVAAHLKNTEHFKMTPRESAEEINITFQNYRKLPVAVDFLRKYPVLGPFVSFTWNLGKIVGSQATKGVNEIKSPKTRLRGLHRLFLLLGVAMIPEIASEISKKLYHFDGKQLDELEKYMASYRRGGSFWYFRGENGEPRIFDMSYIWPIGNLTRPLKGLLSGDSEGMLDALSFMNAPAIDAYQILVKGKDPQWGQEYPGFFDKVAAFAKLFYLPASSPIPSLPALLKGDIRPGALTGPQFKAIIDAYNKQPYGKLQYEKEFPTEVKNFVTGIRTWKLDPEKVLAQYIGSKRAEAQAEQSRFTTWMRDNWKAKDWEIKKKSDAVSEKIKKVLADAEKAARLLHELRRDGFKIKDKQDYNFRKEND